MQSKGTTVWINSDIIASYDTLKERGVIDVELKKFCQNAINEELEALSKDYVEHLDLVKLVRKHEQNGNQNRNQAKKG